MLKRKFRLNTSEFKEVFNFGKTIRTPHFLIKQKENNLNYSRFSVVVSKKVAKKAHERNYLKRKVMHALRENSSQFPKADYILVLNSTAKDVQYKDLFAHIEL